MENDNEITRYIKGMGFPAMLRTDTLSAIIAGKRTSSSIYGVRFRDTLPSFERVIYEVNTERMQEDGICFRKDGNVAQDIPNFGKYIDRIIFTKESLRVIYAQNIQSFSRFFKKHPHIKVVAITEEVVKLENGSTPMKYIR